jgi:hypothetical protein
LPYQVGCIYNSNVKKIVIIVLITKQLMSRKVMILSFLLASFSFSQPLMAQQEGTGTGKWELLGAREVKFTSDRDAILVTGRKSIYKSIKLKAINGNIKLVHFVVVFDDGSSQDFLVNKVIQKGGITQVRDLTAKPVSISRIDFWYGSKGYTGRNIMLQAWGLSLGQ